MIQILFHKINKNNEIQHNETVRHDETVKHNYKILKVISSMNILNFVINEFGGNL